MPMRTREPHSIVAVVFAFAVIAGTFALRECERVEEPVQELRPEMTGTIAFPRSRRAELTVGYNYFLLNKIAKSNDSRIDITITHDPESALDSVRTGAIEIAAISPADSALVDSTMLSMKVDSMAIWVFSQPFENEVVHICNWLDEFRKSDDYCIIRQRFMQIYDPHRKVSADFISPYDSLIKVQADSLGWDWKLLAAVIYHESRFKIEAESPKGASGLMQMVPDSHRKLTQEDIIDPEKSISAGAHFLAKLYRKYDDAADKDERIKFTLAAYNAGVGRIKDCLNFADLRGVDRSCWENIVDLIPEMRDSALMSTIDTVKLGTFKGYETIEYVEKVLDIYEQYRRVCR